MHLTRDWCTAEIIADVRRELLGHSTGRDVNSVYTHISFEMKAEAIDKLEEWMKSQREREKALAEKLTGNAQTAQEHASVGTNSH